MSKIIFLFTLSISACVTGPVVTLDEFNRLEEGMSYEQAVEIIGEPGTQISTLGTIRAYSWKNPGGSNVFVQFMGDSLVSKAQARLR